MATSLIGGMLNINHSPENASSFNLTSAEISVVEPDADRRKLLEQQFQINTYTDTADISHCEIIILAVKPQLLKQVCLQLDMTALEEALFISIAAGIKSNDINRWLCDSEDSSTKSDFKKLAIVRCMPNTPALIQCGATGLYANSTVSDEQKNQAEEIMKAAGIVQWVETEDLLNAVTAVSGSGPAYFFLMMEAMQSAGEQLGLDSETTKKLVLQTALGAARMASESDLPPAELRHNVTSKGGTTEQAILSLQSANYEQIILDALKAANDRSITLADELGSE